MSDDASFDLSEVISKKADAENPYERFGLCRNPFPKSAVADPERARAERFFSRCRKNALEKMREFVVYVYKQKRWSGSILRGEVGSGKSHMLFHMYNEINRQLGDLEEESALAIFVENPKDTINELFQEVMERLGRDVFEAQVATIIEEKTQAILKGLPRHQLFTPTEVTTTDPLYNLRIMGKNLDESSRNRALDSLTKELSSANLTQHRDFARCLSILVIDKEAENRNAAWRFCIGKALLKTEARNLGLVSDKLSEDEIIRYIFPSLIQILNKNRISMLFLFIDEMEKIATRTENKKFESLENLRSLIDNNLKGFCMIFSCLTEAWEVLSSTSPALSDRISEIVDLDPLDSAGTVLLLEDYLATARLQKYTGSSLFPFDEAAVARINLISKGSIRYILQNCNTILEHASLDQKTKELISAQFVQKILGS